MRKSEHKQRQGFILIVILGLLAVLLAVCIGFLGLTRTEVNAVSHVRDKCDGTDMAAAAMDWALSAISEKLIDPATNTVKPDAIISAATDPADPHHLWWYRPFEIDTYPLPANGSVTYPRQYAQWIYLPDSFFPSGGVKGRFMVQVLDANSMIHINDWLDDCNPTQTQMTHMVMDLISDWQGERMRGVIASPRKWQKKTNPSDPLFEAQPYTPWRYCDAWKIATRTLRYSHYGLSPNFHTTNQQWLGMEGVDQSCRATILNSHNLGGEGNDGERYEDGPTWKSLDGISIPGGTIGMSGMTRWAYVDPDTGRAPVNVNTCFRSKEGIPIYTTTWSCVMEAVFNVESLRRIIKIGEFWSEQDNVYKNAQTSNNLTDKDKIQIERLRMKLAYQYQETLCRYFTASYNHVDKRGYEGGSPANTFYKPYDMTAGKNYYNTYGGVLGAAEAAKVKYACELSNFSKTRFPFPVGGADNDPNNFYNRVREDMAMLATNNRNSDYTGTNSDGEETVGVDQGGRFEIVQGKLDMRMASAVFDNIRPGKAILFPAHPRAGVRDPLMELYTRNLGRDEADEYSGNLHDVNKVPGYIDRTHTYEHTWPTPVFTRTVTDPFGGKDIATQSGTPASPGNDIAEIRAAVPRRQLAFGPDWFSTELTTASTSFILVVTSQLVDSSSPNPNAPLVITTHQTVAHVEIAPDLKVNESGEDGSATGLRYYREARPRYYKTANIPTAAPAPKGQNPALRYLDGQVDSDPHGPAGIDSMDKNCATLPYDTHSSVAKEWVDFRDVLPGEEANFYKQGGKQTTKRVIIRGFWSVPVQL